MSSSKVYREIVQAGLDIRSAERVEANLEKQARLLRLIINDNHTTKTTPKSPEPAREPARAEAAAEDKQITERQQRRAQEAAYSNAWYRFILLVFAPLLVAALLVSLAGTAPIAIPLLICMAAYTGLLLVACIIAFFPKTARAEIKEFIQTLG